jgi:hypothetical protein
MQCCKYSFIAPLIQIDSLVLSSFGVIRLIIVELKTNSVADWCWNLIGHSQTLHSASINLNNHMNYGALLWHNFDAAVEIHCTASRPQKVKTEKREINFNIPKSNDRRRFWWQRLLLNCLCIRSSCGTWSFLKTRRGRSLIVWLFSSDFVSFSFSLSSNTCFTFYSVNLFIRLVLLIKQHGE